MLVAMLRAGIWPAAGGCLCLAGDCGHCLATIDGVAYRRMCLVPAADARDVSPHPPHGALPPLESRGARAPLDTCYAHCGVVVIGQGESGRAAARELRAAGRDVMTFDGRAGEEVVGIYPGPLVVAKTRTSLIQVRPSEEIVVATGAAEIQPVAAGNDLIGLVTRRAAEILAREGVALGRVVAIGEPPEGVAVVAQAREIVAFLEETARRDVRRVGAVAVRDADGAERRIDCDTVSLGLGLTPRDALLRLGRGTAIRAVGDAATTATIPAAPQSGVACPCLGVTVADLASVYDRGFQDLELMKRASLAGTGPCQGAACVPHLRSFLAHRGAALQPPFTARPVTRALTVGQAAAAAHHHPTPRTALDAEHRRLGARMDRMGGWWRPWTYGDGEAEYRAVREAVSISDVGTLGKFQVSGPDAVRFLDHLYPTRVATIAVGRSRYAILLNERGYVIDDGMVCRDGETRFTLTFTSGGATQAELWMRDWADSLGADVRILNQTWSRGAINVTGPRATALLVKVGAADLPAFLEHRTCDVAGVSCRVYRLSFTGEVSYELHHHAASSVALWRALLEAGRDLGIAPHGLDTLLRLRLEKGHLIVGQDTDFDSTPRRLGVEWAVRLDKPDFVGREAVIRTNRMPIDRRLIGLEIGGHPPAEGALIWSGGAYAGYVTSSTWSPALGTNVMLGWVNETAGELEIDGRQARRRPTPFYDAEGRRARA